MNNNSTNVNNNTIKGMNSLVVTKKASLLGSWHEDVFTDELLKKIAAHAAVEKGKKAKVKLSAAGLRITRSRFLQADTTHFYASTDVKTVTRNPHAPCCVMFILADPKRKYQIVALRCATEVDAADLVNFTAQMKKDQQVSNVEFRKRDNGNWTLRERSAHNANRHMAELFNEQTNGSRPTSGVQNGDVPNHVPVLDASRNSVIRGSSYVKRQHSSSLKKSPRDSGMDGEYMVETEVETGEQTDEIDSKRATPGQVSVYSVPVGQVQQQKQVLPSKPQVYTAVLSSQRQPVVYRSQPKTYEGRLVGPSMSYFADPWGPHRRVSASFTARSRNDSGNKVTFDNVSIASNTSRKSKKSLKLTSSVGHIPTTIERSIEDTYARPVVLRRHGSVQLVGARPRPASFHMVGTNELKVFNAKGANFGDVAL